MALDLEEVVQMPFSKVKDDGDPVIKVNQT
jgi:hypothetical protein